ncbi:MAG: 50S ribosomal protein L6 [Syntrophomonadaceae bacterium]|jgi:large subunit ribosomal protein L6|nr:50S ribosomal protein L6 [Syntrophomonadaceae bacterium]
MSRIGKKPVELPEGVTVGIEGDTITVQGPKGTLSGTIPAGISIVNEGGCLQVTRASDQKQHRALHGLTRALVANMVEGVTKGFERRLELVGVGYRAQMQGRKLVLSIGYSHPVEIEPPEDLEIEVPAVTKITVKGIDKQKVGNLAAAIRDVRRPEPYKGKGIRYEGEVVRQKAGKSGGR